jgi:hypothetical protein
MQCQKPAYSGSRHTAEAGIHRKPANGGCRRKAGKNLQIATGFRPVKINESRPAYATAGYKKSSIKLKSLAECFAARFHEKNHFLIFLIHSFTGVTVIEDLSSLFRTEDPFLMGLECSAEEKYLPDPLWCDRFLDCKSDVVIYCPYGKSI